MHFWVLSLVEWLGQSYLWAIINARCALDLASFLLLFHLLKFLNLRVSSFHEGDLCIIEIFVVLCRFLAVEITGRYVWHWCITGLVLFSSCDRLKGAFFQLFLILLVKDLTHLLFVLESSSTFGWIVNVKVWTSAQTVHWFLTFVNPPLDLSLPVIVVGRVWVNHSVICLLGVCIE